MTSTMSYKRSIKAIEVEERIQKAISSWSRKEFKSVNATAHHFEVSQKTLARRVSGGISKTQAHQQQQTLTTAEESTLVRWIKQYTLAGSPISNSLLIALAYYLKIHRVRHASSASTSPPHVPQIGQEWIYRFLQRHSEVKTIYARQMDAARFNGATFDIVKRWFDAMEGKVQERKYEHRNMWNMDESGFGIGESQTTKCLIYLGQQQKNKRIVGKQEWVTDIECISASGEALPPIIVWKGKHLNSSWLPAEISKDWHFGTSENGWTSNEIGLEWLIKVFEPKTREKAAGKPRLLIVDGHGSHIQAAFIAHCMEHDIDLLIMPPHCSHLLQPLDVGVFSAFKRAHGSETDAVSRLSTQRIKRPEWLQMFMRSREKALTSSNIRAGWRGTGLMPFNPSRVLDLLPSQPAPPQRPSYTPPDQTPLDLSLLTSSPPDGTELHQSNARLIASLRKHEALQTPEHRYIARMTRICEIQNATIALQAKQLAEQQELLNKRKSHKRGKRVKLDGIIVYSADDVLRIAQEEEAAKKKPATGKKRGRPRKRPIEEVEKNDEGVDPESSSRDSDIEIEECVGRRTRSRKEG